MKHGLWLRSMIFATLGCALTLPTWAAVLRVKSGSSAPTPDGLTWDTAFPAVTNALAGATAGDEVWVAAGVYPGGLTLADGIALYGGFAGNESALEQRNFRVNATILDGERRTNVVLIAEGAGIATRVDGFTIRNGRAAGGSTGFSGAGVRAVNADVVIANNQFLNNNALTSGSAVLLQSSGGSVLSNYFGFNGTELATPVDGGAVAVVNSSVRIEGNSFVGNRGRDGGAVHLSTSTGFLVGNSMLANSATRIGGAVMCVSASPQITHNRFLGNSAASRGGGAALTSGSAPVFFNNVLSQNSAAAGGTEPGGGGLFVDNNSQPQVLNNTLVLNAAPVGGLLISNRNARVANNIVANGTSGVGGVNVTDFQRNNVFGNGTNYVGVTDPTGSAGNLSADPKFAGDLKLAVVNILPESPCRDAGNSSLVPPGSADIDGQPRIQGAAVDIGAHESDGVSTVFLPTIVRVGPNGSDSLDGSTWAGAMKTVQAALELAGRRGGEVWVQAGTYGENLVVRPFTSLYGGFVGSETNRASRNWLTNLTALDGLGTSNVVQLVNLNNEEAVDGFTIQHGAAPAGGGVLAQGKVRIVNNRFAGNQAVNPVSATAARGGGAIYVGGGAALVANNTFVRNSVVSSNAALTADGGAIKVGDGTPYIINNLFRLNGATHAAATGDARGGGIAVVGTARPSVINNTFIQNTATSVSGAPAREQGGAVAFAGTVTNLAPTPALVNNLIVYNSSGVSVPGRVPDIRNNLVWGNVTTNYDRITDPTGTAGNLSQLPGLTGPYGDPHLTAESPARDAGDLAVVEESWLDMDWRARISGSTVDIGADEYDGTTYEIPARVVYVKPDGADTNAGTSWAAAKKSVGAALLETAQEGGEVWVQAGTYPERLRVEQFTYLYGGFKGDETNRVARNWYVNPTVLEGGASPTAPVAGKPVVTLIGTDGYATLDGFTIQNGAAQLGAGAYVVGSPTVAHNVFRNNVALTTTVTTPGAGGGLYCPSGAPVIINNLFVGNSAPYLAGALGRGGAICLDSPAGAVASIFNNTLLTNRAVQGGGIFLGSATGARIANNIVAFGSSGLGAANATNLATANCVFGNGTNNYAGIVAGAGSVASDPRFVDWRSGNYRLRADSPCIDAGDTNVNSGALDLFGLARVAGPAPELGCYEFAGPAVADFDLTLTQPLSGSVAVAPAVVFVSAAVTGGTTNPVYIEYLANGEVITVATNAPFSGFVQGLIAGNYNLAARAVTAAGALKTSQSASLTVLIPPGNVPPVVNFTAPTNNQAVVVGRDVPVTLAWSKTGGRVIRWDLYTNEVLNASNPAVAVGANGASLTLRGLEVGTHVLTAVVTDNVGDKGTNRVTLVINRDEVTPSTANPPQLLADGSVRLEFSAPTAGAAYLLESTADFVTWIPVSTNAGGAPVQITIPVSSLKSLEFFRTRGFYP